MRTFGTISYRGKTTRADDSEKAYRAAVPAGFRERRERAFRCRNMARKDGTVLACLQES
jgi:hypothetical protein